jgi:hypothetical protein
MKKVIKLKRHTNHLISSINCVYCIIFYNVINNLKKIHELQIYLNSYIHFAKQWSYVEFTLFCNRFTLKTTYDLGDIEFKWFLSLKLNKNPKYEKISFSKFVTLRYLKIVRFPIRHLVFLKSSRCIGVYIGFVTFHEKKLSFAINFCN